MEAATAAGSAGKRALVSVLLCAALGGCSGLRFDDRPEPSREQLQRLVDRHANQAEVAAELGTRFTVYAKGTDSWPILERSAGRAPGDVRPLMSKYPKLLFYTTSYQYTWLCFDEAGTLKEFRIGSQ
jgi:hypothetical protein